MHSNVFDLKRHMHNTIPTSISIYHEHWLLYSLHSIPPPCRHLLTMAAPQTSKWLSCGQCRLLSDRYRTGCHNEKKISPNKNTFCGTRYLSHCCRLHGTVVVVTWPWPRQRFGNFCQGSRRDYPWNMPVKFEVRTFSRLQLLAFNAQKLRGHVTVTTPTFRKYLSGVMSGLSVEHACQIWSLYLQPFWRY